MSNLLFAESVSLIECNGIIKLLNSHLFPKLSKYNPDRCNRFYFLIQNKYGYKKL